MKMNRATISAQEIHATAGMWSLAEKANQELAVTVGVFPSFGASSSPMAKELGHFIAVFGPFAGPHSYKTSAKTPQHSCQKLPPTAATVSQAA
jgi:hypothetical protein